jgi:hypothetical protein
MPVKNPSPELLEAIRQRGACEKTGVTAHWGYHPTQEPQIFLLQKDERLPKGWASSPAAFDKPEVEAEKPAE